MSVLRYADRGAIAEGATGEVRRVFDERIGCELAMKVLKMEHLDSPKARERFLFEVNTIAAIQHPGIIRVLDRGEFEDGRPWFTMPVVQGQTLEAAMAQMGPVPRSPADRMQVVNWIESAARAVGFAHQRGFVHRDLKPENVMVGAFGELLVMDWGLAFELDNAVERRRHGPIVGSPAYMSLEQARGAEDEFGPWTDVYGLGASLWEGLTGRPPYVGGVRETWAKLMMGAPTWPADAGVPDDLAEIVLMATERHGEHRYADGMALAEALRSWVDGTKRRSRAQTMVEEARVVWPMVAQHLAEARALENKAKSALDCLPPHSEVTEKLAAWGDQDEAKQLRLDARMAQGQYEQPLRSALQHAPELTEPSDMLADLYHLRLTEAEMRRDREEAMVAEARLRAYDRGRYETWLTGSAQVTLVTEPSGANAKLYRYEEQDRRLVPVFVKDLGHTPMIAVGVSHGSYLITLELPDRPVVNYPVAVARGEHWDGVAPGSDFPTPIWIPAAGEVGPDEVYVPAGWTVTGGDSLALDATERIRHWVDALIVERHVVSHDQWLRFLNDCGLPNDEVALCVPSRGHRASGGGVPIYVHTNGQWVDVETKQAERPIRAITWEAARRYASYRAQVTGLAWRLPHDVEWEKAARGVDERAWPWGDFMDTQWTCIMKSHRGEPDHCDVRQFPDDVGPYGVHGMAGNVREFCSNGYVRAGLPSGPVVDDSSADEPYRMVRGGCMMSAEDNSRLACRFVSHPNTGSTVGGLRLFRSIHGDG